MCLFSSNEDLTWYYLYASNHAFWITDPYFKISQLFVALIEQRVMCKMSRSHAKTLECMLGLSESGRIGHLLYQPLKED